MSFYAFDKQCHMLLRSEYFFGLSLPYTASGTWFLLHLEHPYILRTLHDIVQ